MIKKILTKIILKVIANCISVIAVVYFVKEIKLTGLDAIIMTILLLTAVNFFIKPLVRLLILPFKIVTLGIFNFVINFGLLIVGIIINTAIFYVVRSIYPENIVIDGLIYALKGGVILGVVNWVFSLFIK